jgi:hypothetical protein
MFFPKLQSNYDMNIEYIQNNAEVVTYENDYKHSDDNNDTDTDNHKEISYNDTDDVSTQLNDNDVDNDTQNINTTTRVDYCLFLGRRDNVISAADKMKLYFECEEAGFTDNYVGCKIDMNNNKGTVTFKQPVLMKSLMYEFGVKKGSI